jgi:hypothetical protein
MLQEMMALGMFCQCGFPTEATGRLGFVLDLLSGGIPLLTPVNWA